MKDLPLAVDNLYITIYADDASMYQKFNNTNSLTDELIPAFGKICDWLKCNKIALNSLKPEFMVIGTLYKLTNLDSPPESRPSNINKWFICQKSETR